MIELNNLPRGIYTFWLNSWLIIHKRSRIDWGNSVMRNNTHTMVNMRVVRIISFALLFFCVFVFFILDSNIWNVLLCNTSWFVSFITEFVSLVDSWSVDLRTSSFNSSFNSSFKYFLFKSPDSCFLLYRYFLQSFLFADKKWLFLWQLIVFGWFSLFKSSCS